MGGDHTECTIVHVCWPERVVNFWESDAEDNHAPSPAEEWRAHDSSWEDDLCAPVRGLYRSSEAIVYLVRRRIKVGVDHGRVHLPLLNVSGLPKLLPVLDLVINAEGTQANVRKRMM